MSQQELVDGVSLPIVSLPSGIFSLPELGKYLVELIVGTVP